MLRGSPTASLVLAWAVGAIAAGCWVACERPPVACVSPVQPQDLVVTEIRGKQDDRSDTLGQWVEVCNASASRLPLAGVVIGFSHLDGSGGRQVLVRDRTLAVEPGRCALLGLLSFWETSSEEADGRDAKAEVMTGSLPPYPRFDFSDQWDLSSGLYDAAVLEVRACGRLVDQVVYRDLPGKGTWSLDGRVRPGAQENDRESLWCVDAGEPERGYPGTPGGRNRECGASGE